MSTDRNRIAMRRFANDVVSRGDMAALDEVVSPHYVEHTPFGGGGTDREGLRQQIQMLRSAFPDLASKEQDIVSEGDTVVYRGVLSGTHQSSFMGMPGTGKQFSIAEMHIVRFDDGQFREHWGIFDSLGLMQQLGAIPDTNRS